MGLYVSTTGTNVIITELGITLTHPTTDYDLSGQFSAEEIRGATSLTSSIGSGVLTWKKTSGGPTEAAADYDPDWMEAEELNLGSGASADRVVTFKDLPSLAAIKIKAGRVLAGTFAGNPKKATVTFTTAFPSTNYTVNVTGADARSWTIESKAAGSFVINANANAALTGEVMWQAQIDGEVG